jgi:hypothetical protein
VTVELGSNQTVTVSAAAINGFTGSIAVSVSGLPAGVTADPATFNLTAGKQQAVVLMAAGAMGSAEIAAGLNVWMAGGNGREAALV